MYISYRYLKKLILEYTVRIILGAAVGFSGTAVAIPISPGDAGLSFLGALPGGDLTVDTGINADGTSLPTLSYSSGTLTGTVIAQAGGSEIAAFLFAGDSIFSTGNVLNVMSGSRPLALLFQGAATIRGTIDVSGGDGAPGGTRLTGTRGAGVAGGGNGGYGCCFSSLEDGQVPGGGSAGASTANRSGPGAGGGFGTDGGGIGGILSASAGVSYGDPLHDLLQGGSGGGGGGGSCCVGSLFYGGDGGGAGGGAVEIGALGTLDFLGATILANGGRGGDDTGTGGGGGSGGAILLHAFDINIDAMSLLQANGGAGGGTAVRGACGGAGRIETVTNTHGRLSALGTTEARGGPDPFNTCNDGALVASSFADIGQASMSPPSNSVPEPPAWTLLGIGLMMLAAVTRGRNSQGNHLGAISYC